MMIVVVVVMVVVVVTMVGVAVVIVVLILAKNAILLLVALEYQMNKGCGLCGGGGSINNVLFTSFCLHISLANLCYYKRR